LEQRGHADALYRKTAGGKCETVERVGTGKSYQEGPGAIILQNSAGKYGEKAVERHCGIQKKGHLVIEYKNRPIAGISLMKCLV
jgi:hypothetical protein